MKLILLRHTKSDWTDPAQADRDRPLNDRGRDAGARLGDWLRSRGHLPDAVLCSDAARTRETLDTLALTDARVEHRADLYLAEADTILTLARAQTADCLLVVAHNPGIAEAATRIAATPPTHPEFAHYPTGACLVVDLPDERPGRVLDFVVPRDL